MLDKFGSSRSARPRRPQVHWHDGGTGPAVLLLNGLMLSGLVWPHDLVRRLERRFRVIRLDNRGTGWSRDARAPFTMSELADDAVAVLDAIGVDKAVVAGLSMGGMIAQEVALRHPERVARLIVIASRPPAPEHVNPGTAVFRQMVSPPRPDESYNDFFRRQWTPYFGPGFADAHPELVDELVDQAAARVTPKVHVSNQMRATLGWAGARRLRALDVPTVVVHGEDDPLSPVRNGMRIAQLIPGARYVELAGVGHLVSYEALDRLAEIIEEG